MSDIKPATPVVGVGCLVFDSGGRVLLVCRSQPPQAGLWHIPGGRLEAGETLEACCQREVMEETGLVVRPTGILALADRMIEGFHYVIVDFMAQLLSPDGTEPLPATDAADARWVHPSQLADYPLVEGVAAVIDAAVHAGTVNAGAGLRATHPLPWLFVPAPL